ncbi:MAG: heptaprenyl diphosphate synthase [Nitrosomonadales bacterium]|nr:MAG: heptaprenyl diphosphate synthase [Nitrosomonadales bacterium]
MTRSVIKLPACPEDHRIARLAAFAIGLSLAEAALPSPLPGVKPGLANIITLLVLQRFGWRTAVWVSLLRVVAGSLLLGTFLTPGFVLGFSGALFSLIVLGVARKLPSGTFGPVSHSILAAFAHIAAQLGVVYFWLIPHAGVLYLAPVFAAAALLFGIVNGLVAARLLDEPNRVPQPQQT